MIKVVCCSVKTSKVVSSHTVLLENTYSGKGFLHIKDIFMKYGIQKSNRRIGFTPLSLDEL